MGFFFFFWVKLLFYRPCSPHSELWLVAASLRETQQLRKQQEPQEKNKTTTNKQTPFPAEWTWPLAVSLFGFKGLFTIYLDMHMWIFWRSLDIFFSSFFFSFFFLWFVNLFKIWIKLFIRYWLIFILFVCACACVGDFHGLIGFCIFCVVLQSLKWW